VRLTDLQTRVLERLDEDPSHPAYYTRQEVTAALNWAQRLYVLITLCNETTAPFQLQPGRAVVSHANRVSGLVHAS
jgi:hypothetical protein